MNSRIAEAIDSIGFLLLIRQDAQKASKSHDVPRLGIISRTTGLRVELTFAACPSAGACGTAHVNLAFFSPRGMDARGVMAAITATWSIHSLQPLGLESRPETRSRSVSCRFFVTTTWTSRMNYKQKPGNILMHLALYMAIWRTTFPWRWIQKTHKSMPGGTQT